MAKLIIVPNSKSTATDVNKFQNVVNFPKSNIDKFKSLVIGLIIFILIENLSLLYYVWSK